MLMRFYDPSDGALLFDGVDVRQVSQGSLREQMAVVFQESFLFNTTIRDNIALGKPDATDAEIVAAARAAEIHEFISALSDGYRTMAGERGGRFSGGQRQRIAIARAVLKNPSILLLDEATSALDADTEHAINATLERVAHGRTMVSVTHRLRSVLNMDRIYVLDQGRVVEEGRHEELIGRCGVYAKMWQKQSGVRLEEGEGKATVDASWLVELPLFKGVDSERLTEIAKWFGTEQFIEDRVIVQEGEPGDSFYILVRGTVEVTRLDDGTPRRIAKLQDGDCFGEMALLSDKPRNATVRTLTPCVCLSLKRDLFNRLLEREPELQAHIRTLSARRADRGAAGAEVRS
jgi:ATP-binding cassette subfamily B protein